MVKKKKKSSMTSEDVMKELKLCVGLDPLEKDDFMKELAKESGRSLTLLKNS